MTIAVSVSLFYAVFECRDTVCRAVISYYSCRAAWGSHNEFMIAKSKPKGENNNVMMRRIFNSMLTSYWGRFIAT